MDSRSRWVLLDDDCVTVRPDDAGSLHGRAVEPDADGRLKTAEDVAPAATIGIILATLGSLRRRH